MASDELRRLGENAHELDTQTMPTAEDTHADELDEQPGLSVEIEADTDDAVENLEELRDVAEETREAAEATRESVEDLEDALRSLGQTTSNPEKDMEELMDDPLGGLFG